MSKVPFLSLYFLKTETLWKELVCLFYKSLLPFLTFVNCEGSFLAEGILHNLCPCFDIAFVQLGVITRTRNKFFEIVAASERYLTINTGIKETSVPNRKKYLRI